MIIQSIFPHPLVGRVENVLGHQIERSLEEEHAGHNANSVGGGALEDEVVKWLHFEFSLVIFRRKVFGFNQTLRLFWNFSASTKTLKLKLCIISKISELHKSAHKCSLCQISSKLILLSE